MDTQERSRKIEEQRKFAQENKCRHMIQCANTPELRENAIELMRSGVHPNSLLGAAMLSGPCVNQ